MKPFKNKNEIFGNWATLILPIRDDESIDYVLLEEEIDFMISCRVDGIYSNGTAGEFYTQDRDEFYLIQSLLSKKCNATGIPFQIGASHMSPQECLLRVEVAARLEPGAIQIILPDWFPVNLETAVRFLNKASEIAGNIPLILYNPPHAKVTFTVDDWKSIYKAVSGLKGIKVAGGDDDWYRDMAPVLNELSVFIQGHHLASGVRRGAMGAYSNMACLHPLGNQRWYDLISSDPEKALAIEGRIQSFMDQYISPYLSKGYPNHACDKCMAVAGGWLPGLTTKLRFPYSFIPQEDALDIGKIAKQNIPEFFE
jgi:dihydrodipicolinate synthase/N-acetylneuraminate lyase